MKFIILAILLPFVYACPEHGETGCAEGEHPCPGGVDADFCPLPDVCSDGGCCFFEPVACGDDEIKCGGLVDPNGCVMPDLCMPNGPCTPHCPIACEEPENMCFMGLNADHCENAPMCSDGGMCFELILNLFS